MSTEIVRPQTTLLSLDCQSFIDAVAKERKATLEFYGLRRLMQWMITCADEAQHGRPAALPSFYWPDPDVVRDLSIESFQGPPHDMPDPDGILLKSESIHETVRDLYAHYSQTLHLLGYLPNQLLCTRILAVKEPVLLVFKAQGDHRYATWH